MKQNEQTCKVCGYQHFRDKMTLGEYSIIECNRCGFVQIQDVELYEKYDYSEKILYECKILR